MILNFIRGIIRPVITIGLLLMVGWFVYWKLIEPKEILAFFGLIVGFYFGERKAVKQEEAPK
jgi:hypothetical protein